jgi:secreted trypsin-like serine protease
LDLFSPFCLAEVGSPAFQWIGNRWELMGIATYATDDCPRVEYRGLYVRVSAYQDWIESILSSEHVSVVSTGLTMTETSTTTAQRARDNYACNRNMPCGCGYSDVSFRDTRILGGEDAIMHSWSMIVSLRFYESTDHFCAGTLLSNSYVLTAAHCVDRFSTADPVNITVVAGLTNQLDAGVYLRSIDRIYLHPNYTDRPNFLNDIALLHMRRPLYFQNNPVLAKTCVLRVNSSTAAMNPHPKNGTQLVMIGWGAVKPGSFVQAGHLKQIRVSAIDDADPFCRKLITDSKLQFCVDVNNGDQGKFVTLLISGISLFSLPLRNRTWMKNTHNYLSLLSFRCLPRYV